MSLKGRNPTRGFDESNENMDPPSMRSFTSVRYSVSNPPPADFMPTKKNRGRKKRPGGPVHQLPPMDLNAEKKLEELQQLASGSAALQHALVTRARPLSSRELCSPSHSTVRSATMTGTEAEFLARQIHTSDLSQLSLLSNSEEFQSAAGGIGGMAMQPPTRSQISSNSYEKMVGDPSQTINEALREKVLNLEGQVRSLTTKLQRRESELEKKESKLRALNQELQQSRQDTANEIRKIHTEVCSMHG